MADPRVIREAISSARLAPYLARCAGDVSRALELYAWNAEISAACWVPLGQLEVVVRNAIHDAVSARIGSARWWDCDTSAISLRAAACADAAATAKRLGPAGTADDVVAKLTFGFWSMMLDKHHEDLWRRVLRDAFPRLPVSHKRSALHRDLDHLRVFRNRVAHLEPIHHRDLAADYDSILRIIGVVSPPTAVWVDDMSQVIAVLARRPQ